MKKFSKILVFLFVVLLGVSLFACGSKENTEEIPQETKNQSSGEKQPSTPVGQTETPGGDQNESVTPPHQHTWDSGTVTQEPTYNKNGVRTYTCSCGQTRTEKVPMLTPTAKQAAEAREAATEQSIQNYDFSIELAAQITVYGYSGSANATYDGKYRFNKENGDLKFYRETGGNLLFNSKEYIYTQGDSRLKVTMDKNNTAKKVAVSPKEDDELNMLNLPFVKVVDLLEEENLTNVKRDSTVAGYDFSANMKFSSDYAPIKMLLNKVGAMGANIAIKDVTFTNPQEGVKLHFNLTDDGKMFDFFYTFVVSFPIQGQNVQLNISYKNAKATQVITLPDTSGLHSDATTISQKLSEIQTAVNAVKTSSSYSLDMTAKNDFDAGWNSSAIVDKYVARMYKNTNGDRVDFNHSFMYKSHTEEDGKESFKYTVGNIQDGTVYEISRKGSNSNRELTGVTVDTSFDYLTSILNVATNDIDFIQTKNVSGAVEYHIYLKDSANTSLQQAICDILNANTGDGVLPVENYFNSSDYDLFGGSFVVTVKNGKLVGCSVETEMRYTPVGGNYTDDVITLKNSVELTVNENADKAKEYTAPKSVDTQIGSIGLNNAKYYIL